MARQLVLQPRLPTHGRRQWLRGGRRRAARTPIRRPALCQVEQGGVPRWSPRRMDAGAILLRPAVGVWVRARVCSWEGLRVQGFRRGAAGGLLRAVGPCGARRGGRRRRGPARRARTRRFRARGPARSELRASGRQVWHLADRVERGGPARARAIMTACRQRTTSA